MDIGSGNINFHGIKFLTSAIIAKKDAAIIPSTKIFKKDIYKCFVYQAVVIISEPNFNKYSFRVIDRNKMSNLQADNVSKGFMTP